MLRSFKNSPRNCRKYAPARRGDRYGVSMRFARAFFEGFLAKARRALARAARDRLGAVAVEFGFVVIPLLFTLVTIFQIGYNYYVMATLDRVANEGARAILTGQVSQNGYTAAQ